MARPKRDREARDRRPRDHRPRDHRLGAALSDLDVPAHRPGFWAALDDRLVEDRVARRSEPPGAEAPHGAAAMGTNVVELAELAEETGRRSGRRRPARPGRWLGAAAAVLAVAAALGVLSLRPDDERARQEVATVQDVAGRLSSSLAGATTIGGTLTETMAPSDGPAVVVTSTFVRRADGSFRLTALDGSRDVAYDAPSGIRRELTTGPDGSTVATEETGVSPGFPDGGVAGFVFADDLATIVRTLAATPEATITETERDGRAAWVLETPISPDLLGGPGTPDNVRLVIDRATVTPVRYTFLAGEEAVLDVAVSDLVVDGAADPGPFTMAVPEGVEVTTIDHGFRRVTDPLAAAAAAGYPAAVPGFVPEGFELAEAAVAERAQPTGAEGGNPPSTDVISLSYRRGFEQLVVTTRRAVDPEGFGWSDPFGAEGVLLDAEERELGAGRFAGVTVEVATTPPTLPHLWGESPEVVFTVSGSLDRDELVAVAESLS